MLVIFEEKNYIVPGLILHQEYLKICVKKGKHLKDINLENFNSIETFFDLQNFDTSVMPERGPILKKLSYLGELDN